MTLPDLPRLRITGASGPDLTVELDGKPLTSVVSLRLTAAARDFTRATLELDVVADVDAQVVLEAYPPERDPDGQFLRRAFQHLLDTATAGELLSDGCDECQRARAIAETFHSCETSR